MRTVSEFDEVYVMFGDHANVADLVRVGIDAARCCVILSDLDDTEDDDHHQEHYSYAFNGSADLDTKTITKVAVYARGGWRGCQGEEGGRAG